MSGGQCHPFSGRCTYNVTPDGGACDDGRRYTVEDQCVDGMCIGKPVNLCVEEGVVCEVPSGCYEPGECNPDTGICTDPIPVNGRECDDGDPYSYTTTPAPAYDDMFTLVNIIAFLVTLTLVTTIQAVYAVGYKKQVTDKRQPLIAVPEGYSLARGQDFKHGTFKCCDELHHCCIGCYCAGARASDTYAAAGVVDYWCLFRAFSAIENLVCVIKVSVVAGVLPAQLEEPLYIIAWSFLCLYLARKRSAFRTKLGGQPSFANDCICFWCCPGCTIIQDARQLDGAQHVKVECSCTFKQFAAVAWEAPPSQAQPVAAQLVGNPVGTGVAVAATVANGGKPCTG